MISQTLVGHGVSREDSRALRVEAALLHRIFFPAQGRVVAQFVSHGRMESVSVEDGTLGMQIQVGQATYQVELSDELLFFNRQEVLSICEHDERQLIVSPRVTPRLMAQVLAEAKQRIAKHLSQSPMTTFED